MEKWRILLAVVLILGIFGLLLISPYGGFLRNSFSGVTGFFASKPSGQGFPITIKMVKESYYGHSFKLTNSSVILSGVYQLLKVGDQVFTLKNNQNTTIIFDDYVGSFEYTSDGIIKVSGQASYFEFGDLVSSSGKPFKVYLELVPTTIIAVPISEQKLVFTSAYGYIERYIGNKYAQIGLSNDKLEVDNFAGSLRSDGASLVLDGLASNIKGDNFTFV
jgi:hypothetical protein